MQEQEEEFWSNRCELCGRKEPVTVQDWLLSPAQYFGLYTILSLAG